MTQPAHRSPTRRCLLRGLAAAGSLLPAAARADDTPAAGGSGWRKFSKKDLEEAERMGQDIVSPPTFELSPSLRQYGQDTVSLPSSTLIIFSSIQSLFNAF